MAGIDLATAQSKLTEYLAAETAVLGGQSYKIGERMLHRADLAEIRKGVDYWDDWVKRLTSRVNGAGRTIRVRPNW